MEISQLIKLALLDHSQENEEEDGGMVSDAPVGLIEKSEGVENTNPVEEKYVPTDFIEGKWVERKKRVSRR